MKRPALLKLFARTSDVAFWLLLFAAIGGYLPPYVGWTAAVAYPLLEFVVFKRLNSPANPPAAASSSQ